MKHFNGNKLVALLAAVVLALSLLTGCGSPSSSAAAQSGADSSSAAVSQPASEPASGASSQADDSQQAEIKHITLTVTYADGHSDELAIDTEAEFLKEAIEDQVELGGEEGEYGFYIESVNGEKADYDADGAYWAIYVNGEYGMYGVDSQPVADGDSYALVYTVG